VLSIVISALAAIGKGQTPNSGFNWTQRRRGRRAARRNNTLRDWLIRSAVYDLMVGERPLCWSKACLAVSSEAGNLRVFPKESRFRLGVKQIETICSGITVDTPPPDLAEGIFPADLSKVGSKRIRGS
jgi:hypothetical protein